MNETIVKAKIGDSEALGRLYTENVQYVYRYVYSNLGNREISEDLVSEIFIKAFKKLSTFKGESGFRTWLMAISRNMLYDYYKSKKMADKCVTFDEDIHSLENEEENLLSKEKLSKDNSGVISALLHRLNVRYAEVLRLRFLSNLTIKECSDVLKVSENYIKVLQNRAIKQANKLINNI